MASKHRTKGLTVLRWAAVLLFLLPASGVTANEQVTLQRLKVGVFVSPPFVIDGGNNTYSGMAIDLWKTVEDELNFVSEYVPYPSYERLLAAAKADEIDIAVTSLTVTYNRTPFLKFSYPWYDSGLRIITKDNNESVWEEMSRNGQLKVYVWIIVAVLVLTLVQTLVCRKKAPGFPKKWKDGLAYSFFTLMHTLRESALDYGFLGWWGHLIAVLWMVIGIGTMTYITSSITSSMTKVSLTSDIDNLSDLPGELVGVETGSVEETFLRTLGIRTVPYDNIVDAIKGIERKEVDAVVGDAPVLEYWEHKNPKKGIHTTGSVFCPNKYSFACNKKHSALMDQVSVVLIRLHESGKIKDLKENYLGVTYE